MYLMKMLHKENLNQYDTLLSLYSSVYVVDVPKKVHSQSSLLLQDVNPKPATTAANNNS